MLESYKRNEEKIYNFKERLRQAVNSLHPSKIKVIESIERPPKPRITPRLDSSFDVRSQEYVLFAPIVTSEEILTIGSHSRHHWMNNIRDFAVELRTEFGVNYNQRRPKVAIIDDGVNPEGEFLGQRIAHGWPPDEPKSNSEPFYASARGHGTQMAKIICHACPFAQLYVAKLDGWKDPDVPHPLNIVDTNKVHYLFPGEVILENDNKAITGSSAATALAAGTAAMILFCYELGYGKMETIAKPGRMGQLFNSLKKSTNYVDVESILNPGQTPELVVKECAARVKEIRDEENLRAAPDHRTSGGLDPSGSTASFAPPIRRTTGPLVVSGGR